MDLDLRAKRHAALGDERRLQIVDRLALGDLTVSELASGVQIEGNLLAHHLEVLEQAGLIDRRVSEGDHRRRYVSLRWQNVPAPIDPSLPTPSRIAFVCTHNSARSQFASALWRELSNSDAWSAGTQPADRVHPKAVEVATDFGLDLSDAVPAGYDSLPDDPDLIISVCDRARESGMPEAVRSHHWSIPDPVPVGSLKAFRSAFEEIAGRMQRLLTKDQP